MGTGIGIHQHRISLGAHKVGHPLVGDIRIGGLGVLLPDGDFLTPLVKGGEFLTEAVESLVTVHVHGLKGIGDPAVVAHSEAHRDGLVLLVHIVILDLFHGQQFAVQLHRHFPGAFSQPQGHPFCLNHNEQRLLRYLNAAYGSKPKYLIQLGLHQVREHLKAEGSRTDEADSHLGLGPPEGIHKERDAPVFRLVRCDIVQKILRAFMTVVAVSLCHIQRIPIHIRMVALDSGVFYLDHCVSSFKNVLHQYFSQFPL